LDKNELKRKLFSKKAGFSVEGNKVKLAANKPSRMEKKIIGLNYDSRKIIDIVCTMIEKNNN